MHVHLAEGKHGYCMIVEQIVNARADQVVVEYILVVGNVIVIETK